MGNSRNQKPSVCDDCLSHEVVAHRRRQKNRCSDEVGWATALTHRDSVVKRNRERRGISRRFQDRFPQCKWYSRNGTCRRSSSSQYPPSFTCWP